MTPNKRLWVAIGIIILVAFIVIKASLIIAWHLGQLGHGRDGRMKDKNYCPEQRNEVCTEQYDPVCGWFGQKVQCIKYPCAQTYSNSCFACADNTVSYWTPSACPQ